MTTSSTDYLRSYVASKYFLKELLRETTAGPVFLALAPDDTPVVLNLSPASATPSVSWPAAVEITRSIPHNHLLRYWDSGETRLEGQDFEYLVSERVEDRLETVLSERALTAEEADPVLRAVLLAIEHLHRHGYVHGAVSPAAIVAAGGVVKLTADSVRSSGSDETEAKRARAADLLAVGETATELLTRQTGPAAVLKVPTRFANFIRATAGTPECPSPTAAQLLDVLDGKPIVASPPIAVREPERVPERPQEARVSKTREPIATSGVLNPAGGRRRGNVLVAVVATLVISLVVLLARRAGTKTPAADPLPAASATAERSREMTTPEQTPQPATGPSKPAPVPRAAAAQTTRWAVIAATYSNYAAASKRASQLRTHSKHGLVTVLPPEGQGARYYVVLGTAGTKKEADVLKARAMAAGMPHDTYVTRIQF